MSRLKPLPFELTFERHRIEAFAFGELCFQSSNNFADFDKVVITTWASTSGEISIEDTNKVHTPLYLAGGDIVEFTIMKSSLNELDTYGNYNVEIGSTSEIEKIKLECINNSKNVVNIEMPVKFLHEENHIQKMMKVCHYCLKEECKCGAEKWVYVDIPILKEI